MPDLSADRPLPFTEDDVKMLVQVAGARLLAMTGLTEMPASRALLMSHEMRAVLTALAAAGRLLPPDAEHREEWGVRMDWVQGPLDLYCTNRATAEDHIANLAPSYRGIGKLIRRVAGPWVEVDPNE